ncbi:hypothetical protein BpHYR1_006222 [Brachionus plicatilis]|uniref:Uncharacterized protein n=1 Tax=Brachionus plicatilis TaxID=10195 RepID=A0A3M7S8S6_BRAPC|nr:hypothetical protein BpHYR1_006222 [Brachionus plicatilis]
MILNGATIYRFSTCIQLDIFKITLFSIKRLYVTFFLSYVEIKRNRALKKIMIKPRGLRFEPLNSIKEKKNKISTRSNFSHTLNPEYLKRKRKN